MLKTNWLSTGAKQWLATAKKPETCTVVKLARKSLITEQIQSAYSETPFTRYTRGDVMAEN